MSATTPPPAPEFEPLEHGLAEVRRRLPAAAGRMDLHVEASATDRATGSDGQFRTTGGNDRGENRVCSATATAGHDKAWRHTHEGSPRATDTSRGNGQG